jgi:phospholipid/cholesterol/gamma-HCH transport system substrate-binding protein
VLTPRRQSILIGAISLVVIVAAVTIGIRAAFGEFAGGYRIVATFDAAGQGLISGSDVKIRGVNVGEVDGVRLVDGRAEVTMRIFPGEEIPRSAFAEIRPKTLFGEKFVNVEPGQGEGGPDVLAAGEEIVDTRGGFELEQVLSDTYPLLQAVDPVKLALVLGEMADAGAGLGETVNRSIVNSARLARLQAENLDNLSSFLADLADLSDELGGRADAFVDGARDLSSALPVLVEGEDDLVELLEQTSRLSRDASDLIVANRPFMAAAYGEGSRSLDLLFEQRDQIVPLVVGLRQYLESLARVGRIPVGDGTVMAAVKGIMGTEVCELVPCRGAQPAAPGPSEPTPEQPLADLPGIPGLPDIPLPVELPLGTSPTSGSDGLRSLFEGLLGP